jgi:glycosyltransferase involved in cell wall biosynthesis
MKKRLLVVSHYYASHRGGIEIVADQLARRLANRGWSVVWAASAPVPTDSSLRIAWLPMRTCNVTERTFGIPYPLWGPISLLRLCAAIWRCDLVHLHDCLYAGSVVTYLCARFLGKPVVVTQHVGDFPFSQSLLRWILQVANRLLGTLVLGGCNSCVFISKVVQDYFTQFVRYRYSPCYIPNGVDQSVFHPISPADRQGLRAELKVPVGKPLLLFVGRFVEKKGVLLLREVVQRFPEWEWLFVGWGKEDPQAWGLANVRCQTGVDHPEIARYFQAADLLVLPSFSEGFPLVVQEAMACGTPALVTPKLLEVHPGYRP